MAQVALVVLNNSIPQKEKIEKPRLLRYPPSSQGQTLKAAPLTALLGLYGLHGLYGFRFVWGSASICNAYTRKLR